MPDNFGQLRKLEVVYAGSNALTELPSFEGCESLKEIHMANNRIKVRERIHSI